MEGANCENGVKKIQGQPHCPFVEKKESFFWYEMNHEELGIVKCAPTIDGHIPVNFCPICGADVKQIKIKDAS